nr:hypothetical protein [Arthrobacter sp. C9C5]
MERDAARLLASRAQQAAIAALKDNELMKVLPQEKVALVKEKMTRLYAELLDGSLRNESVAEKRKRVASRLLPSRPSRWTPRVRSWRPERTRHGPGGRGTGAAPAGAAHHDYAGVVTGDGRLAF